MIAIDATEWLGRAGEELAAIVVASPARVARDRWQALGDVVVRTLAPLLP
jgi:hypothetical protein